MWLRHSQSLARRRKRPGQANMRSTIQRLESDEACGLTRRLDDLDVEARQNPFDRALQLRPLLIAVRNGKAPNKVALSNAQPSQSWMPAACTMACISRPWVSTRMCHFLPLIFLPAS